MTLNRYRLQHLVKKNHKSAIRTHRLLKQPDRLFGLITIGNNLVNILASALATLIAIRIGGYDMIVPAIALLAFGMLVFSEVTPKTLGALRPEFLAFLSSWIYLPLLRIFYPVVWVINTLSGLLLRIFGVSRVNKFAVESLSKDELKSVLSEANQFLPARYQNMLVSILDLESATVADIMTHRNEIVGIDLEEAVEDIVEQLTSSPHTCLPVFKKNIDRVVGFLHIRTVLSQINQPDFDKQNITNSLIKPFFVPSSTSIHKQIQVFKNEKLRMGLVVDEYGDVLGLITLDDLLQELVGELVLEEPDIKMQKDGSYLVDAGVTIRELNRVTYWELPTEGPKTLNGLIVEYMETIPESGTSIKLYGHVIEIIKRDENAVKLVKASPIQ